METHETPEAEAEIAGARWRRDPAPGGFGDAENAQTPRRHRIGRLSHRGPRLRIEAA